MFADGIKEKNTFLSHDCRMMQGGKNLRQHLAYPQAETWRDLRSGEVAWGFTQLCPENLQGQKLHNLSVQPVPAICCPYGKKDVFSQK